MKQIFATGLCLILLVHGVYAMANSPISGPQAVLTMPDAQRYALKGYQQRAWGFPPEYARAMEDAKPGDPLLVERLDRPDTYYYLVPFTRGDRTTLVVMIDARNGDFKEAAPLKTPASYLPISLAAARINLTNELKKYPSHRDISKVVPTLVWMPSEQSQSPFEPLWRFKTEKQEWFVDQQGKIYKEITAPGLKGGGF